MDVRCPQCHTVYEVDDLHSYSAAITLQCSQCNLIFRLDPPPRPIVENQRRWMLRHKASGDILYFNTFDVLHRWIMERSVSGQDSISRTGQRWTELKDIGEFAPIFQTVESIASIAHTQAAAPGEPPRPSGKVTPPRSAETTPTQIIPGPTRPVPPQKSNTLPFGVSAVARNSSEPAPQPLANSAQPARTGEHRSITPAPELPAEPEETWSLGDLTLEPLSQDIAREEPTVTWVAPAPRARETSEITLSTYAPRKRTGLFIATAALLLAAAGAAFVFADDLQTWWLSTRAPEEIVTLGEFPAGPDQADQVHASTDSATDDNDTQLARTVSSQQIQHALATADQLQKAQTPPQETAPDSSESTENAANIQNVNSPEPAAKAEPKRQDLPSLLATARQTLVRGNARKARSLYHQATQLDPQNAEAITGLGWSLLALGNTDSAIAQFQRARHRDPSYDGSYIGIGRAERDRGNFQEALLAYEDYLKRFPDGPQASIARYQSEQIRRQLGQ